MWQLVGSFATVAVFVGVKQGLAIQFTPAGVSPVLVLGLVNTGIACYLYFSSLGRLGETDGMASFLKCNERMTA